MDKYKFSNIAGYKNEISELKSLANVLKNVKKLKLMGGHLPRGLILLGDNGVGKTCLAEAFIAESGFECIKINMNIDCEDITDYYENKFEEALSKKPCIIFIDELDKIVGEPSPFSISDVKAEHSNALLQVVNDHRTDDDVFLLATANFGSMISESLLRSGRFDKKMIIYSPNASDREEIFKFYIGNKKMNKDVTYKKLACDTAGFSGADIESIVNDATINAFKKRRKTLCYRDFSNAISDKIFSSVGKESEFEGDSLRALAYHEIGHLVVSHELLGPGSISIVSINSRGPILGHVKRNPNQKEMMCLNDKYALAAVAMGGRVAEEMFCNEQYTGSASDISRARQIITSLIKNDGYKGYEFIQDSIFTDMGPVSDMSENMKVRMENLISDTLDDAYRLARKVLRRNESLVAELATELICNKTLTSDEVISIIKKSREREKNSKQNSNQEGLPLVNGVFADPVDEIEYQIIKSKIGSIGTITQYLLHSKYGVANYKVDSFFQRLNDELKQSKQDEIN